MTTDYKSISQEEFKRFQPLVVGRRKSPQRFAVEKLGVGEAVIIQHITTCGYGPQKRTCATTVMVHTAGRKENFKFQTYHKDGDIYVLRIS